MAENMWRQNEGKRNMIYVMSNIHGNQEAFDRILSMIGLTEDDQLFIIGDVVDRGPRGTELLRRIRKMPRVTMMLGNHEYMMVNWLRHRENRDYQWLWYRNGGEITEAQFMALSPAEREDMLGWLEDLPVQITVRAGKKDYLLVHACPVQLFDELGWRNDDRREFAVWKRIDYDTKLPDGPTVVFGHTPTIQFQTPDPKMRIWRGENRIGIDCGCAYPEEGGQLASLRLDDLREYYSAAQREAERDGLQ